MPQRNVATHFTFEQQRQEINLLASDFWSQKTTVDTAADTYLKADGTVATTAALTLGGNLVVPNAFTINPDSGNGTVTISGNLQVDGTTTTLNSTTLEIADKNIIIAKNAANDAAADGAGITIDSGDGSKTLNWIDSSNNWTSSESWDLASGKGYHINNTSVINSTTLGSGVINSSLTSVGTLTELTVNGDVDVSGNSTFGANGSITSGGNFTLNGNGFVVTGSQTAVGEFKGATIPTIQITQTTDNTDLQLRANATGGLVRTAGVFPLIFGTAQEERLRIHESNAFVTVNNGNAEANSALILSKTDAGYAKLEFDVGTSQKAYVELDASENLIHYGAAGVNQQFYAGGSSRLTITDGGDVKIGLDSVTTRTDSAHFGFNITGKSGTGAGSIFFNDTADNCDANIAADNGVLMITADYSDNTADSAIKFRVDGSSEKLVIKSDGEIRIDGPTSATHGIRFTPNGWNGYDNRIGICGSSGADSWWSSNWNPTDGSRDSANYATNYIRHNVSTGYLSFGAGGVDASATEKLRITSDKVMTSVDFKPDAHHQRDIGTAANAFKDIYSETITTTSVYDSRGSVRRIGPVSPVGVYDVVPGVGGTTGRFVFTTYDVRLVGGMTAGDVVTIINNGSSDITIDAATNSVTLTNSADASTGDRTLASKGMATVLYVGSATAFISGAGLS